MTPQREVMQMALNALNHINVQDRVQVIEALRAALAQPEPEPVAWVDPQTMHHLKIGLEGVHLVYETEMVNFLPLYDKPKGWRDNVAQAYLKGFDEGCKSVSARNGTTTGRSSGRVENIGCLGMPVNTPVTPPQRNPLSDEEIKKLHHIIDWTNAHTYKDFARAIEAAHGIKD